MLEREVVRKKVQDTDDGEEIKLQIADLMTLLDAYQKGIIKEQK